MESIVTTLINDCRALRDDRIRVLDDLTWWTIPRFTVRWAV
jgi:hypothetical protein